MKAISESRETPPRAAHEDEVHQQEDDVPRTAAVRCNGRHPVEDWETLPVGGSVHFPGFDDE